MKTAEKKREFDLSKLSLKELVEVLKEIDIFIKYLETNRIEVKKEGKENG